MPRSAADATRFTATGPHASIKVPSQPSSGPKGETPQEKVQRLRAAAQRAKDAKISPADRIISSGRVWADRAHRFTGFTLIGITVVTALFSVYSIIDMRRYTRAQSAKFFEEQRQLLQAAETAFISGTPTDEQLALLEKEGKIVRTPPGSVTAEVAKLAPPPEAPKSEGILAKSKKLLFWGLKKDESQ